MKNQRPNIVFFLIDDMGWKDVGFMGSEYYETPTIDKAAKGGMVFSSAYANAPNCAPSRACLMSGLYTPRHGIYTVGSSERGQSHMRKLIPIHNNQELDTELKTISEALKEEGYVCGHVGKWHLGEGRLTGPEGRGFDVNVAGSHKGHPPTYFSPYRLDALEDGPQNEYLTDRLTDEAVKFIDEHHHQPFFLYFAHYAVHAPLQAKEEITEKYRQKQGSNGQENPVYAAMIESTDQSVGKILNKLDELGLTENTVVCFFSDNGGASAATSQAPLRGSKGMLYEGGIRVPMFVSWPGVIEPGTTSDIPVSGIDFFPTFLEIAGLLKSTDYHLDGYSLMPLLTQSGTLGREAIFWHFPAYLEGKRGGWRTTPGAALRAGDWKLIQYFEDGCLELYNLKEDIGENNNLADQLPEKAQELYQIMLKWREEVHAPVPTEANPEYAPDKMCI